MCVNDAVQDQADIDAMRNALRDSKGGQFPQSVPVLANGKKGGVQVIPISEVAAKDEFLGIKGATRDDVLAAHQVPPQLLGIVPNNAGGFGDVEKAARVFARNELLPLQTRFRRINDWIGDEVVKSFLTIFHLHKRSGTDWCRSFFSGSVKVCIAVQLSEFTSHCPASRLASSSERMTFFRSLPLVSKASIVSLKKTYASLTSLCIPRRCASFIRKASMHRFFVRDFASFSNAHCQKSVSFFVTEKAMNARKNVAPQTIRAASLVMHIYLGQDIRRILHASMEDLLV